MALGGPALSPVAAAASLPPDTMPLSAVRAGMVCRGLTVVRGSTIADFRADVVDVASDPGGNTGIIVRVSGGAAEPAGIAEGFSGSPILCPGDDGRERFVGALAATAGDRASRLGFVTPIEAETAPRGLNEDIIRFISAKKNEPEWLLEFRLKAYRHWLTMTEPTWSSVRYPKIDFQNIIYFAAPKPKKLSSMDEVDPELLRTFEKLGVPVHERAALAGVAVDVIFDSVSVATTYKKRLAEAGVIFCSMSEAVREHPELVRRYLGSVVPPTDNFYAALNSAVFTDGSFCFIPKGVRCPMELSTYFRINTQESGQFERTLIIAEEGASVSYLEGCTAPKFDSNQLHAAVVELVALDGAEIKYSTVQNWYAGDEEGRGVIYNFVTKRGLCKGAHSKISWTQVETGSAITWKYPSCVLLGENSIGEFYSVALTNHHQQADTGTKMIHIGRNTRSRIVSKGISAGQSRNSYRGLVKIGPRAEGARNYSQCDSLLIGPHCGANTFPYIQVANATATVEHEATTSKIGEDQLFYFASRGIGSEEAVSTIINGFCREVFRQLPMEFAVEATK
ncbi:MAG: Fe-S cluster assembly protein SufB, partial [Thermoleophilum sp.]|nr:Fe-S cluster assembly protein SufB [Thermoleophilum sp.]